MAKDSIGGHGDRQTPNNDKASSADTKGVPDHSASLIAQLLRRLEDLRGASVGAALLTDEQLAAEVLNVSPRTAAELMKEPWAPRPVMLGPRLKRHVRAEWEAAIANAPRQAMPGSEPAQLRRAKIERMKAGGVAA